jgi:PKD repeat protein
MKINLTLVYLTFIATLSSCNKEPKADFTSDKNEYIAGDVIKLTNNSIDAKKYKWILPDYNTTSTEKNIEYILPANHKDATLFFTLQVFSNNEKNKTLL